MKKLKLADVKKGDYILLITMANLTFAGYVEKIEKVEENIFLQFKPSSDSPLWITVRSDFIKNLDLLIEDEGLVVQSNNSSKIECRQENRG